MVVCMWDPNVLRFLWAEDPFDNDVKLVTMRFTRVVFGVSSSPFLLNATVKYLHLLLQIINIHWLPYM